MDYSNGTVRLKTKQYPIWWNGTRAKHVMEEFIENDGHHNLDHEDIQKSLQKRKEIWKLKNKNKYIAFTIKEDGVYWTLFTLRTQFSTKFAVIITNYKRANTMKHARKQLPKSAKKVGNPSSKNDLAYEIPEPILRDYKKLVKMGDFDSLEELIEMDREAVEKFQLRN